MRRPCPLISRFRADSMGRTKWAQPGAGETSLTQTIFKIIYFSLVLIPQCGPCSFLCWHEAQSGSGRETNRWLDGKWDGSFQRQSLLMPAYSTHTALAWPGRSSCCLAEGFFACSDQSSTLLFWDVSRFRKESTSRRERTFLHLENIFLGCIKVFWDLGSLLELSADTPKGSLGLAISQVFLVSSSSLPSPWWLVGLVQCLHPESRVPGSASPGFSPSPGNQALGVSAPFGSGVMEHFLLLAGTITGASPSCPMGEEWLKMAKTFEHLWLLNSKACSNGANFTQFLGGALNRTNIINSVTLK